MLFNSGLIEPAAGSAALHVGSVTLGTSYAAVDGLSFSVAPGLNVAVARLRCAQASGPGRAFARLVDRETGAVVGPPVVLFSQGGSAATDATACVAWRVTVQGPLPRAIDLEAKGDAGTEALASDADAWCSVDWVRLG